MPRGLSRREALAAGSAAVLAGAAAPAPDSLDALAQARGVRFGSALGGRGLADPAYRALVAAQCGALVAENEHKLYSLMPQADGAWRFGPADAIAAFAREHGMVLRGHTLVWNKDEFTPAWVKAHDFGGRGAAARWLTAYVKTVAGRYPQVQSWDVVNETVDPATGAERDTALSRAVGPDLVELSFHAAREAAPDAKLVYNDYMGWGPYFAKHRAGVLKLLARLKAKNVPIDALGIQGHIGGGVDEPEVARFPAADQREWRAFLDEARGMGLDLLITELDANDKAMPADIPRRDAEVAALTRDYLDLMLSYPEMKQVLVWGLADHHSWLQGTTPRPDGLPKRPTPYDAELRAKPMREAVAAAFRAAPERTPWA